MMIEILGEIGASFDAEQVVSLLMALLAGGGVGAAVSGKLNRSGHSGGNDALDVNIADKYVTKDELRRLESELHGVRTDIGKLHERVDVTNASLHRVCGKLDVILSNQNNVGETVIGRPKVGR